MPYNIAAHQELERMTLQQMYFLGQTQMKEAMADRFAAGDVAGLMEIRESGSASDFPGLLGVLMYRQMMDWFDTVPDDWRAYSRIVSCADYRPRTVILGAEAENLLFVGQNGQYQDSREFDRHFTIQVTKFGRLFRVDRTVVMNDDLGYIQAQPERFGRAAARTLSTYVPQSILEANPNTFDGQPLFSANHVAGSGTYSNLSTGGTSALGLTPLQTGIQAMMVAKAFDGVLRPVDPSLLIVPAALKLQAFNLIRSATVVAAGGQTPDVIFPSGNPLQYIQPLMPVIDRYLTNQTAWYLMADPNDIPTVTVAFLKGDQDPQLLVQRPQSYNVAGGDDPYTIDFDDIVYKVRYEFGGAPAAWWGASKFAGV